MEVSDRHDAWKSQRTGTKALVVLGPNARIGLFVAASVLSHAALTYALPHYTAPEPQPEPVTFALIMDDPDLELEPEFVESPPEPEHEPEHEPEPEIVRPVRPIVDQTVETPQSTVEAPLEEVEEVEDVEIAPQHSADVDASAEVQGSVHSTRDGLTVARVAGTGNDGSAHGRALRVTPPPTLSGVDRRTIVRGYLRDVQRALGTPRFSRALQRAELDGVVMVGLRIDPAGRVHAVRVKDSSGHTLVDEAALEHVRATVQVPAPPDVLDWVTREITLPIRYVRRAQR